MTNPEPTKAQLDAAASTFAMLSAPVRLHLVSLAAQGEYDVGTLADRVGATLATPRQHLGKLRLAGIITARREGRRHIYTVDDPHVLNMVDQIFEHIAPDGTLAPRPTPPHHPAPPTPPPASHLRTRTEPTDVDLRACRTPSNGV